MSNPPAAPVDHPDVAATMPLGGRANLTRSRATIVPGPYRAADESLYLGSSLVIPTQAPLACEVISGTGTASQRMRDLRIAQAGEDLSRRRADPYTLPAEGGEARKAVSCLFERVSAIRRVHDFSKGTGLAAPQIGIPRRAAIVLDPDVDQPIVLINPVLTGMSAATDEPKYEGCLSFFDVRGRLVRPMFIRVQHELVDGMVVVSTFTKSTARLVAHEIDHLDGVLYVDRMAPGEELISVAQYRGTGGRWDYDRVSPVGPEVPPAD